MSNRVYGATSNADLPNYKDNDYAAIARSMGLERVFEFTDLQSLDHDFRAWSRVTRVGIRLSCWKSSRFQDAEQKLEQPPFDGPS